MKGVVFTILNQMVEEKLGLECWEAVLAAVKPESQGVYTSVEDYSDEELFALVTQVSEISDIPVPTLVESFGEYLFGELNRKYPLFTEQQPDFFSFLHSIDDVIHQEVRKLYESPNLPSLTCEQVDEHTLRMRYESPRKLCLLAEGLIRGAAKHYGVDYELDHQKCMHRGDDHCMFHITTA